MKNYSSSFQNDKDAKYYDEIVYRSNSYDSFIWKIQSKRLALIFEKLNRNHDGLIHLDFACGTGRIISFVENTTIKSMGIDISSNMISIAKQKITYAELLVGDISSDQDLFSTPFDVITAFRFFLNAEPHSRKDVMEALSSLLRGPESRLIFNIQGNKNSLRHFVIQWSPKKGERINEMSYEEVRRLVEDSGLEIESWYGYGVTPQFLHRSPLGPLMRIIDRIAGKLPLLKRVSHDLLFVCRVSSKGETVRTDEMP